MNATSLIAAVIVLASASFASAETVKMSQSKICHDNSSRFYERTKNFTSFDTIEACLNAGGRLPNSSKNTDNNHEKYSRSKFEHWIDENGDCINTRHELLIAQSTSTIDKGNNKCTVERGRWLDPYTGKIFHNARQVDVDHLVPLYWSWKHGAEQWTDHQRRKFANDASNLFIVEASTNREKGAKPPWIWLPPDSNFHCQYVLRFKRIVIKYNLQLTEEENKEIESLLREKCR